MRRRPAPPTNEKIADYWKDKCISKDFEIIDYLENDAQPVILDWGEPSCMCCGLYNLKVEDDPRYEEFKNKKQIFKTWDLKPAKSILEKAHIIPYSLGVRMILAIIYYFAKNVIMKVRTF